VRRHLAAPLALVALLLAGAPAEAEQLSKDEFKSLKRRIARAASQDDAAGIAAAVNELARDDSERAAELIAQVALAVPDGAVYEAASAALAEMTSEEATAYMVDEVEGRANSAVKILIVDAFALREDHRTGEALGNVCAARRQAPEVLRATVDAIGRREADEAVMGLLDLHERLEDGREADGLLMSNVREVLVALTGRAFDEAEDWRKFWQINRGRPRTGGDMRGPGTSERVPKPTFFGTEIKSQRLVFVIDVSGSMQGDRLQRAKDQLVQVLQGLNDDGHFTIVAFSAGCRIWNERLQEANDRNKGNAIEFVQGLQASGNTLTLTAMEAAFEVEGADAIVLLSDGAPTETDDRGQPLDANGVLKEINALNRFRRWQIDTFGFDLGGGMMGGGMGGGFGDFMRDLAESNDGTYTEIR